MEQHGNRIRLQERFKENWYALLVAMLSPELISVEEALQKMGVETSRTSKIEQYTQLRDFGYSWKEISDITGRKNPRSNISHYKNRKRSKC